MAKAFFTLPAHKQFGASIEACYARSDHRKDVFSLLYEGDKKKFEIPCSNSAAI